MASLVVGSPEARAVSAGIRLVRPRSPAPALDARPGREVDAARDPELALDVAPALDPELALDVAPALDPAVDPALDPAVDPALDRGVDPALDAETAPLLDPERAPAAPTSAANPRRSAAALANVPLIGRERELGDLRTALDVALEGSGRVVLLSGEPGIGKTRLAGALCAEAELRGVPVWSGRGFEDGSAPAFWPWSTSVRRWIDRVGRHVAAEAAGAWSADLAHVFPALRERAPEAAPSESVDGERARFRVFEAVSRFLSAVASPAGLVVVLEDLHWADLPSLKLLEFVAADLAHARLLVVATYRDTEVPRDHPLRATLSRLSREASTLRIALGGLSPAHCARWLAYVGLPESGETSGAALHRETYGNPFFVGELVHLLSSDDDFRTGFGAEHVPLGVREVIARRLDRLGEEARSTLAVAALLGDVVETGVLADVLGERPTADHLERGVRDRILVEAEGRRGRYSFAHALIRRVLADEIAPSTRAGWHARIAAVLERRAAVSEVVTTELVHHFAAAGSAESLRKAFEYACTGAEQAERELGWEEAVRLYEVALDLGARSGAVDAERAIELRLALARALRGAGDVPAARARCAEVLRACRRTQRPALLARAALIHVGPTPEFGRVSPAERAVLEEACRSADALDDGLRARLHARLAGDLIAANDVEQADRVIALCDDAAAAARRAGDTGALAMALLGAYYAAALRIRPRAGEAAARRRSVPRTEEILATAEAGGEHEMVAAIRHLRAAGLFALGEADAFSAEVDELATAALASRVPDALCLADFLAALRALVEGRFDEGHGLMDRALATGRRLQVPNAVGLHVSQRILSHFARGRLAEIAPDVEAFVDEHPGGAGWEPVRALARLARGDAAGARADLQTLLAAGLGPAEAGVMSRCYLAGLALLCVELGDRESAPELYEAVARQRETWIVDGCHTFGPWALVQGALARLCGRPAEAVRLFEKSIAVARRMRARPFLAAAQVALAEVRLSMDPRAARDEGFVALLLEASRTADELGLVHVAERAARLRASITERRETTARTFRCDGDVWTVSFGGRHLRLKDGKGPRYLATLLAAPGREIHVLELAGAAPADASAAAAHGLTIGGGGTIEDAPDARAARAYRERLDDLRAELEEAEERCDRGRAERLREELDLLVAQLAQRFGARARASGPAETARKAVTKVLRTQIGKLLEAHPPLGEHLRDFLRMGTFCSYAPPSPIDWDIAFGPA